MCWKARSCAMPWIVSNQSVVASAPENFLVFSNIVFLPSRRTSSSKPGVQRNSEWSRRPGCFFTKLFWCQHWRKEFRRQNGLFTSAFIFCVILTVSFTDFSFWCQEVPDADDADQVNSNYREVSRFGGTVKKEVEAEFKWKVKLNLFACLLRKALSSSLLKHKF